MSLRPFLALAVSAASVLSFASSVRAQTASPEILARDPAKLVEVLKDPAAPVFEKAKACQRLAVVGTKDAVPALVALLPDEALNEYARTALEGIPDASAAAALRDAAAKLNGRPLVGVIASIGQRKDADAVALLQKLLEHKDGAVVSAAARSLGLVAPEKAAGALTKALAGTADKSAIADAALLCAEGLTRSGKQDEAVALYAAVAKSDVPGHLRADALQGQMRLLKAGAKDLLLEQLRSSDERFFNLGLAMAREVPGADVAQALVGELEKLPPARKALLLRALGDRPEPVSLKLLGGAIKDSSPQVREAAVVVLAKSNDPAAVSMLFEAALGGDELARPAQDALKVQRGPDVDASIVARLSSADARSKAVLIDLIGARRIVAARDSVAGALNDKDVAVRRAALAALAQIIDQKNLPLIVKRAQAAADADETAAAREALTTAALRMGDREASAAQLAETLAGASTDYQVFLLELFSRLGGQKSLSTVVAGVKSPEPPLKDAATRLLGDWPSPDAAPALLEIARQDPDARFRIRALRGYLRIARQLQLAEKDRLAMFRTGMETAQRDDEKKLALDILTRIPSAETLGIAASYLGEPALRDTAADAAVKIAPRLPRSEAKAVTEAMRKVVDAKIGGELETKSKQLLEQAQSAAP